MIQVMFIAISGLSLTVIGAADGRESLAANPARYLAAALALSSAALAHAQVAVPVPVSPTVVSIPGSLDIKADQPGAIINRDIFGQFAEHLGRGIYGGV